MPTRFPEVKFLIFDLDGTLIDSKLDLALSVNAVREHLHLAPLPHDQIFSYIGSGVQKLIERALGEGVSPAQIEWAMADFLDYYRQHMLDNTVPYPGVREGLESLRHWPMAILTNKPVKFSRAIVDGLDLTRYFRAIYGGNSFAKKKPDPIGVAALLAEFQVRPREAMVVGDSAIDVQTARSAGTWMAGVRYGLDRAGLEALGPDILLDTLMELPACLNSLARELVERQGPASG